MTTHFIDYAQELICGRQRALCGEWATVAQMSPEPSCPECARILKEDAESIAVLQEQQVRR